MGCGGCGSRPPKNNPFDKRGNSLKRYAFLNPNQIVIRDAEDKEGEQDKDKEEE